MRRWVLVVALGLLFSGALIRSCGTLPPLEGRTASTFVSTTGDTLLGRAIEPRTAAHPGRSGIYPLLDGRDAFAARILLAQAAERTLDVQYYIWHGDLSGTLMFRALQSAADRGVRVRLLLDDNGTSGLDTALAALDTHPNIEVRLFNPFVIRAPRAIGYLTDFRRLNRRMHNKSFTADNQATIIGGRNVGDEYFDAATGVVFADLDVIGVGPVVGEVSRDFDRYWASESSYPAGSILPPAGWSAIAEIVADAESVERDPASVAYVGAIRALPFVRELTEGTLAVEWAPARMISDDPAKGLGRAAREELLFPKMQQIFGSPKGTVDLVSPYFVPGEFGVELFSGFAKRGVRVRVLTNSLEATDVAAVHAGYARRRRALLQAGVTLYEMRAQLARPAPAHSGSSGSSGSSLHAKTFAVDGQRLFIGSFNFDPRSASLNTEMGFVIESPALAGRMETVFDRSVPEASYEIELSDGGRLRWVERRDGRVIQHNREPGAGFWKRLGVSILAKLPIEWLLVFV
jgi:putative cardiolipin synthase